MNSEVLSLILRAKDEMSKEVQKAAKSLRTDLKGAAGVASGALKELGRIAMMGAAIGIGALGGAIALGVRGLQDEEVSTAKLTASLKANIAGWDGNTAAIERATQAGMAKGYDDDDLRNSMATLVAVTKNEADALNVQTIAMDFARLKGIDLQTASDLLGKVYGGNVGILSRYGIQLKEGATATEALAAMQALSAGQADAYGNTTAGAMDTAKIAFGEATEQLATALMPAIRDLAQFATTTLIPAIRDVVSKVGDWFNANKPLIDGIKKFAEGVLKSFGDLMRDVIVPALGAIATAIGTVVGKIAEFVTSVQNNKTAMDMLGGIGRAIGAGFDIAWKAIQAVIDIIATLITKAKEAVDAIASIPGVGLLGDIAGNVGGAIGGLFKARGGPVGGGRPYIVGESGPELFVPAGSGSIIPNDRMGAPPVVNITVIVQGLVHDPRGSLVQDIANGLAPAMRKALAMGL